MFPLRNVVNCEISNLIGKGTKFTRFGKEEWGFPTQRILINIRKECSHNVNSSSNEWIQSKLHQQTEDWVKCHHIINKTGCTEKVMCTGRVESCYAVNTSDTPLVKICLDVKSIPKVKIVAFWLLWLRVTKSEPRTLIKPRYNFAV